MGGCRLVEHHKFAPDRELEGGSKEQKRLEAKQWACHSPKTGQNYTEKEKDYEEDEFAAHLQHYRAALLPDMRCSTRAECSDVFQQSALECAVQSSVTRK